MRSLLARLALLFAALLSTGCASLIGPHESEDVCRGYQSEMWRAMEDGDDLAADRASCAYTRCSRRLYVERKGILQSLKDLAVFLGRKILIGDLFRYYQETAYCPLVDEEKSG